MSHADHPEHPHPSMEGTDDHEIQDLVEEVSRRTVEAERAADAAEAPSENKGLRESWAFAIVLASVTVAFTVANLLGVGLIRTAADPISAEEELDRLYNSLLFAVEEIEVFHDENGSLPDSLAVLGLDQMGDFEFERVGAEGYRVTAFEGERSLTYDSGQDFDSFFGPSLGGR